MDKFFNKTKQVLFLKQKSIFSSAIILSVMIVVSRFFGFFRFRILAGYFSKEDLDIFFASFRIPDLVFEVLITGALTSAFIPIIIRYQENKEELNRVVSSVVNLIFVTMLIFIAILFFFADKIIPVITLGYDAEKIQKIIFFSRILMVGQLPFLIFGNILTGIGQANKAFFLSAVAPIIYNVSIIVLTLMFSSQLLLLAPVVGVLIGAVLFFVIQVPTLFYSGFSYKLILEKSKGLTEFIRVVIPRAFTVIVAQIDATVDLTLTTFLGTGSYTVFYLAQHLQLFPVSVIGIAFGQASLPYMAQMYQEGKLDEYKKIVIQSILNLFFFAIPIAAFLVIARTPTVRLFFGGQKFDWEATVLTAYSLSYFALGLPSHTIYYFLTRCFYAFLDSKTPFYISLGTIVLNTLLSLYFVLIAKFPVWALAGAFSFSMFINVLLLLVILARKVKGLNFKLLFTETAKIFVATFIPAFIVYFIMKLLDGLVFDTTFTINVFFLLATGFVIYTFLYLFLAWVLNVYEIYIITKLILKAKEYQKRIFEFYSSYE